MRDIFTTSIQLMYKIFREMEDVMFPARETLRRFLPRVFKTMKNVPCTVDCTEFRIQTSRNFAHQGNTYSQYKHSNTLKCLIAVTPNGGACFVSELFEGDITDVQIFAESGILKHLNPYDIILADRGFTVQDLLNTLQANPRFFTHVIYAFFCLLARKDYCDIQGSLDTRWAFILRFSCRNVLSSVSKVNSSMFV